jgi:DTW domain-containing protein YfiP
MHPWEFYRPSSTGHLVKRLIPASGLHLSGGGTDISPASLIRPGKELWILHPQGDPPPEASCLDQIQVLLIDGSWKQAAEMLRPLTGCGRTVRLPLPARSRYLLRTQQGDTQFSTIEALMFLLGLLGIDHARTLLNLQFELHVYAGLLSRGKREEARQYLVESPARDAFPELIARLDPAGNSASPNGCYADD